LRIRGLPGHYRQAAALFTEATKEMPGGPWALHRLRHSALTHAAEDGASNSTLLAYSGHTSVRSLARYAQVSAEALGAWQAQRDRARRRKGHAAPHSSALVVLAGDGG
jgi:integrase